METVEEELLARSLDFIERSVKAGKPFFLWHNTTRMHVWTRLSPKWENKSGYGLYADGMMELDDVVGRLLKKLDDLGIADNTIVVFTTDNGAEIMSLAGRRQHAVPRREGHDLGRRHARAGLARWPGVIKPGTVYQRGHGRRRLDADAGRGRGRSRCEAEAPQGLQVGDKTFKNHLDGYNFLPFFKGEAAKGPRREIFYFDDNANLNAVRIDDWKISFKIMEGNIASATLKPAQHAAA